MSEGDDVTEYSALLAAPPEARVEVDRKQGNAKVSQTKDKSRMLPQSSAVTSPLTISVESTDNAYVPHMPPTGTVSVQGFDGKDLKITLVHRGLCIPLVCFSIFLSIICKA